MHVIYVMVNVVLCSTVQAPMVVRVFFTHSLILTHIASLRKGAQDLLQVIERCPSTDEPATSHLPHCFSLQLYLFVFWNISCFLTLFCKGVGGGGGGVGNGR